MRKKMMKALKDLNGYIDNDREKLCDRLHDMELSHKRMEKLLKECLYFFNRDIYGVEFSVQFKAKLINKIKNELSYPYFRVNYRMKGGKNA